MVSQHCKVLLSEQFGTTQVVVFGSLGGDSPWRWQSDPLAPGMTVQVQAAIARFTQWLTENAAD